MQSNEKQSRVKDAKFARFKGFKGWYFVGPDFRQQMYEGYKNTVVSI